MAARSPLEQGGELRLLLESGVGTDRACRSASRKKSNWT